MFNIFSTTDVKRLVEGFDKATITPTGPALRREVGAALAVLMSDFLREVPPKRRSAVLSEWVSTTLAMTQAPDPPFDKEAGSPGAGAGDAREQQPL